MAGSHDVHIVSIPLPDPGASDAILAFQAPSNANGGGITVVAASAVNHAATAGGTSFLLGLLKYSNAGTPAVNGTIAANIGGSTSDWADSVPKSFTLGDDVFVDAGEWIVINYTEETAGNPTRGMVNIHYVMGR